MESPDTIKDFPDSDDTDKVSKKELLIGKRKDKKDKKDKERGYAALEGESSADESSSARSPSKIKKAKPFKFSSKSKEKREKSRDKEIVEKKKDKEKKADKKVDKEKKSEKKERKLKHFEEYADLIDKLPIFGVKLELAIERSRCHDGIDVPLPVRVCIDYIQDYGLQFEGVYKVTGNKSKVLQLKKMYNCREEINCSDYDIPTITSLLKMFVRDLPDPILTNELLVRFEEAGAILNIGTREKHLKILVENLPSHNKLLLSYLILHFDNIILNEKVNKMNLQTLVTTLAPIMHVSNRLLTALMYHCNPLFSTTLLKRYIPPLKSNQELPTDPELINDEIKKQESLLAQIHMEIQEGFIARHREELMWETQRIITQLKRTYKNAIQRDRDLIEMMERMQVQSEPDDQSEGEKNTDDVDTYTSSDTLDNVDSAVEVIPEKIVVEDTALDKEIELMQHKNRFLVEMKSKLHKDIEDERTEILSLKQQLKECQENSNVTYNGSANLDELMHLLNKENQILLIKKINLVRQIMEQQEICVDLKAKLCVLDG